MIIWDGTTTFITDVGEKDDLAVSTQTLLYKLLNGTMFYQHLARPIERCWMLLVWIVRARRSSQSWTRSKVRLNRLPIMKG